MKITNAHLVTGLVVLGLVVAIKAKSRAGELVADLNPAKNDNIINRQFLAIYGHFTDGLGTLGTDIYDITHRK